MPNATAEFLRHWNRVWQSSPSPDGAALLALYSQSIRHYHNAAHVVACLEQVAACVGAGGAADRAVRLAIFYHDAIYDPKAHDNESRSAELARDTLAPFLDRAEVSSIERLIRATDHKQPPAASDEALIVDADLSILGQPQATFDAYEWAIRAEYAWVPDDRFCAGRTAVLRQFLERPHIFSTAWFHGQYEAAARVNLSRALARLGDSGDPPSHAKDISA